MLTLARISPRNNHLKLFGGAHFHWRSLKVCNLAKRTCLNYVWTVIFPWSYCSLKLQILILWARIYKTVDCRFTLKRQKQSSEVFYKKRCSKKLCKIYRKAPSARASLLKKRLQHRCFPVNFAKFLRTSFLQSTSWWLPLTRT